MATTKESPKKSPADDLICPITRELPWDPVTAEDGKIYERHAIVEHFKTRCTSPLTNQPISQKLLPATQIRSLIETLVENGMIEGDLAITWNGKMKQQKELEELKKTAEDGDPLASLSLGRFYESGEHWLHGIRKDDKQAATWYKKAHKQGSITGTAMVGNLFCSGQGGEHCHTTGIMYLSIAAGQGSRLGAYYLGMAIARGAQYGILYVDKTDAIYWLEKALGNSPDCIDCLADKDMMEARKMLQELCTSPASGVAPAFLIPLSIS